jgi:DNA primase
MGRIPDALVREILDKTDIVAVIGERVRLMRRGGRWLGLCPFHAEKSPSFNVDADKGLFYCFGCQKGGSVVQFLMELDKLSFPEAMEELAKRANIALEVEEAPSEEEKDRRALLELYERLAGTFHWLLCDHPSGKKAQERIRERGLKDEIIEEFRLGYVPSDRRWMNKFLRGKGYSEIFLARSGLFAASSPGYPIFAHRIMFPISDQRGRVIAFGGRLLEGDGPKYINSPDTLLFRKQDNLFALDKALPHIKKAGEALICEGYMDALSFHAAGIKTATAPLGTAFTASQARSLKRWADRILLCFDADDAGRRATERACAIAAQAGLVPRVVALPGGKDASEILEKEGEGTLQRTGNFTINGEDFLVRQARELFDLGTVEGKAKAAAYLYPYADALDSDLKRNAFLEFASRELGANPRSILEDYEAAKRAGSGREGARGQRGRPERFDREGLAGAGSVAKPVSAAARTTDLVFMATVVLNAECFAQIRSELASEDLDDFRARDLYIALEEGFRADDLGADTILGRIEDEAARRFVMEGAATGEFSINSDRLIADGIQALKRRSLERKRERILARMARNADPRSGDGEDPRDEASLNELLYEKMHLDAELESMKGERDERS